MNLGNARRDSIPGGIKGPQEKGHQRGRREPGAPGLALPLAASGPRASPSQSWACTQGIGIDRPLRRRLRPCHLRRHRLHCHHRHLPVIFPVVSFASQRRRHRHHHRLPRRHRRRLRDLVTSAARPRALPPPPSPSSSRSRPPRLRPQRSSPPPPPCSRPEHLLPAGHHLRAPPCSCLTAVGSGGEALLSTSKRGNRGS